MKTVYRQTNLLQFRGAPTSIETAHIKKITSTLDLVEQWSEVKAVEFWQPAKDNFGAVSVVLNVVYKLTVAHSCQAVLVFIHR